MGSSYTAECDESLKPAVGTTFEDIESAREFYKAYAAHVGFPVRVGQHKAKNGLLINKCFYCSREGFRKAKDETQSEPVRSGRRKCEKKKSLDVAAWQWLLSKERLALAHQMHTVSFVPALVGLRMLGAYWKDLQELPREVKELGKVI